MHLILDGAGVTGFVALFVQATKFLLGYVVPDTSTNANNWTRLYVYGVALVVIMGGAALLGELHTGQDVLTFLSRAFAVGMSAILGYHALTQTPVLAKPLAAIRPTHKARPPVRTPAPTHPPSA